MGPGAARVYGWGVLCYSFIVMRRIEFTSLIFKEGTAFVSYCPELSVSSCGDSVEAARTGLKTAVRLFLEESAKLGTLKTILEEEGFVPRNGTDWIAPPLIATEHSEVAF